MKIFGITTNYVNSKEELNGKAAEEPVIFLKPETAFLKNGIPFYYPDFSNEIFFEVELVIKINSAGKNISEKFASNYYNEIAVGIDFTAKDIQRRAMEKGQPWSIAKGFNGSAPVSDFIALNNFPSSDNINFSLMVNGQVKQKGHSGLMVHNFDRIVSYISKFFLLKKGDLIFTGTPFGPGPIQIGDTLQGFIEDKKLLEVEIK